MKSKTASAKANKVPKGKRLARALVTHLSPEAVRLKCAQAICRACLRRGAPIRNHGDAPALMGGYCSGTFIHKVRGKFVNCAAEQLWSLEF